MADSLWAFHQDAFDFLSEAERADLLELYPQDLTDIPDVFAYRRVLLGKNPDAEERGRKVLFRVMTSLGMDPEDVFAERDD